MHENERIARELFDAVNQRDVERGARVLSEHCELTDIPFGEVYRGPDGWRQQYNFWLSAFPDGEVEVTHVMATDRGVVVEYVGRGKHDGPLQAPGGEVAPTGRRTENRFCDIMEIEDGKIVRVRSYFDVQTLMRQLGLTPPQVARA